VPFPKRSDVDDYFAQLPELQRPHLADLRALSHRVDPLVREVLKWNTPAYVRGSNTNQWILQNFTRHCSLRFSTEFFGVHKDVVAAAGYEYGEGFIKLPYDLPLPIDLLTTLMRARVAEFEISDTE
jgi:uncharacterized protein YdhG (YjbR/CyaY superfamily)